MKARRINEYIQNVLKREPRWLAHRGARPSTTLVVFHSTAGSSLSGAVRTLIERKLSYHYLIDKDGTVYKCLPRASFTAHHAGNSYGPEENKRKISKKQDSLARFVAGTSVNSCSLGISFVSRNTLEDPPNEKQLEAAELLVQALKVQFPTIAWVTTHAEVSPKRKSDPVGFDLDSFAETVGLQVYRFEAPARK